MAEQTKRTLRPLKLALVAETKGSIPDIATQKRYLTELFKKRQRSCCYCGHFSPILRGLEIDHLDGNHANFEEDNLDLACHWCHAARHLEFSLRAGARLVMWDYPQVAVSRLTLQALQTAYLRSIYSDLVEEGEFRLEVNFPDGQLNNVDLQLRAQLNRGDYAGANRLLEDIQASSVRLAFPDSYLSQETVVPSTFSKESWDTICDYYKRLKTNILIDNERRVSLINHQRELRLGKAAAKA